MAGTFARVLLDYELADTGLQDFVRGGNELGPDPIARRSRRRRLALRRRVMAEGGMR